MYNDLFDVLYSFEISEDTKSLIIENLQDQINEEVKEASPYIQYINTLIKTDITNEALDEVLSMTFGSLSEAEIDEITEEFIKSAVISYIAEAGFKFYGDPRPIGLTGLNKEVAKREAQANQPKKPSAMDRLKSAVGKVKSWADKIRQDNDNPIGLSRLQAEKEARINKAVKMGTGPETSEAPKAVKNPASKKPANRVPKAIKEPVNNVATAAAEKPVKVTTNTSKKEVASGKAKTSTRKPKVTAASGKSASTKNSTKSKLNAAAQAQAEQIEAPKSPKKSPKSSSKGKELVKVSKKKQNKNEAFDELINLLNGTTISETLLKEITEMKSNKEAARAAVERDYKDFTKAVDALNKVEETKARTGLSPVSPEQHDKMLKKAEEKGARYERFKSLADKKFGLEC